MQAGTAITFIGTVASLAILCGLTIPIPAVFAWGLAILGLGVLIVARVHFSARRRVCPIAR